MLHIIHGHETSSYFDEMKAIYRHRHEIFVEKMGWKDLQSPDRLEADQFDHEDAVHIALFEGEKVTAYSRMLPTTRPHLLTTVYPEILEGAEPPVGNHIKEWTRCSVVPSRAEGSNAFSSTSKQLFLAIAEWALVTGNIGISVQFHPLYITRMLQLNWSIKPLALESLYDGKPFIPVYAEISDLTLNTMRQFFGIEHSTLPDEYRSRISRDPLDKAPAH